MDPILLFNKKLCRHSIVLKRFLDTKVIYSL